MKVINGDRYYDTYECAALLGVTRYTIYNLRRAGRLPVSRLGARDYTREADIAAYLHAPLRPAAAERAARAAKEGNARGGRHTGRSDDAAAGEGE